MRHLMPLFSANAIASSQSIVAPVGQPVTSRPLMTSGTVLMGTSPTAISGESSPRTM